MLSRGQLDNSAEVRAALKAEYIALLEKLEAHFIHHPYMLGGHPSNADYSLMGALHAHMGRDPEPLRVMQNHAPRVFRFMEHMLVPEVQSPEFFATAVAYPAEDLLPETFLAILEHLGRRYGRQFEANARAWAAHAVNLQNDAAGELLAGPGEQPALAPIDIVMHDGETREVACNLYPAWVSQRAQIYYAGLDEVARRHCDGFLNVSGLDHLTRIDPIRRIERTENRLTLGGPVAADNTGSGQP